MSSHQSLEDNLYRDSDRSNLKADAAHKNVHPLEPEDQNVPEQLHANERHHREGAVDAHESGQSHGNIRERRAHQGGHQNEHGHESHSNEPSNAPEVMEHNIDRLANDLPNLVMRALKYFPRAQNFVNKLANNPAYAEPTSPGRVGILGMVLGFGLAWSAMMVLILPRFARFYMWIASMCVFQILEYFCMSLAQPRSLSSKHILLFYNRYSLLGIAAACVEYWLGSLFMPKVKAVFGIFGFLGLLMAIFGQTLRTVSMLTAGNNFNYDLAKEKQPGLKLVTEGVYKYVRHPSYHGIFWLVVGQQVLLGNPICTAVFAYYMIRFISKRIAEEEQGLLKIFGNAYADYSKRVPVGWPFHLAAAQV